MTKRKVDPATDGPTEGTNQPPPEPIWRAPLDLPVVSPTEEELLTLPPAPEGSGPVFRYEGEDLWRTLGYAYCSIQGIQGWKELAGDVLLPNAGLITAGSFGALGIAQPPGGVHADIYATPDGPYLYRAATLSGDFYLDGTEWKPIHVAAPSEAGKNPNVYPGPGRANDQRPASELSVRIRRIRGLE
jgi:hypothetical protein